MFVTLFFLHKKFAGIDPFKNIFKGQGFLVMDFIKLT